MKRRETLSIETYNNSKGTRKFLRILINYEPCNEKSLQLPAIVIIRIIDEKLTMIDFIFSVVFFTNM